jgi:hypothetical protein
MTNRTTPLPMPETRVRFGTPDTRSWSPGTGNRTAIEREPDNEPDSHEPDSLHAHEPDSRRPPIVIAHRQIDHIRDGAARHQPALTRDSPAGSRRAVPSLSLCGTDSQRAGGLETPGAPSQRDGQAPSRATPLASFTGLGLCEPCGVDAAPAIPSPIERKRMRTLNMIDVHDEIAATRERLAGLEKLARLGRAPTPGTGPGGALTLVDAARIAADPIEYDIRRNEIHALLEGRALDSEGEPE